ncbi:MAG: helix-turn-helix domain-containing protein [Victivallaceae bacterium]
MYNHVRKLISISTYAAPSDRKVTPVQIPSGVELVELLTGGKIFFEVDGVERIFQTGAIFWHRAGEYTICRTPPENPYRCTVFRFEVDSLSRPCPRVSLWSSPDAALTFSEEALHLFHAGSAERAALTAYIYSAIALQGMSRRSEPHELPRNMRAALDYIERNFASPLTNEAIAGYAQISRPYLFTLFQKHFGQSPHRYLLKLRNNQAKLMLSGGDLPIKEIAAACGFESLEVFYRQFRRQTGLTPGEYRVKYSPYQN